VEKNTYPTPNRAKKNKPNPKHNPKTKHPSSTHKNTTPTQRTKQQTLNIHAATQNHTIKFKGKAFV
jgi:hypothetical protein